MAFTVVDLKVTLLCLMAATVLAVCLGPVYALYRLRRSEADADDLEASTGRRSVERRRRRRRELWVSRMSVFAAGVFVSVGLMDLFPDACDDLLEAANVYQWRMRRFPMSYFLMLCGFFLVLVLEQIVLSWKEAQMAQRLSERRRKPPDQQPPLPASGRRRATEADRLLGNNNNSSGAAINMPRGDGAQQSGSSGFYGGFYGTSVAMDYPAPGMMVPGMRRVRSLSDIIGTTPSSAAAWRFGEGGPLMVGIRADPVNLWGEGGLPEAAGAADAIAAEDEIEAMGAASDDGTSVQNECEHSGGRDSSRGGKHHGDTFISASQVRTVLLVAAMSVHSLFEGLSLGLIPAVDNAATLFAAIMLHKLIVAFSIGMQLSSARLSVTTVIACAFIFALMSPTGCVVGMLVIQYVNHSVAKLVSGVLQSLTSGTFLYVAFFEVLPHEFNTGRDRLGKLLALILGFTTVCVYVLIDSMKEAND